VAAERPATNDAVQKTAGLALLYDGKPIDAMYSSTCGGRTEDFSNVFDGPPVPYLKSVACTVEDSGAGGTESRIAGQNKLNQVIFADDGGIANRDLELAFVLGLARPAQLSVDFLSAPVRPDEVRSWTERALKLSAQGSAQDTSAT
jgi:SpoIID/LytB domain protein